MIRRDEWKLNYYHGLEPQLFNLAEDPRETHDLAKDPGYVRIRQDLVAEVLNGWDPEVAAAKMAAIQEDQMVLQAWARSVDPPDAIRWDLRPEMDYLDGPNS
jgi:choline-sulfatase